MQHTPSELIELGGEDTGMFEEPDPRSGARRAAPDAHKLEAAAGLVLLVLVLGFALFQWSDAQARQARYRDGERAMSAENWQLARDTFAALPGYRDSAARSAEAARLLTTTLALSGTVAMRPDAQPPGLYYNRAGLWQYLGGSDASSRVIGSCGADLIYGRPWGDSGLAIPTQLRDAGSPPFRRAVLASTDGTVKDDIWLDPNQYGSVICGHGGVWADTSVVIVPSEANPMLYIPFLNLQWQGFNTLRPLGVRPPLDGLSALSVMPDHIHILYAKPDLQETGWHTGLYTSDAAASTPRFLSTFPGIPASSPPSQVGDSLLVGLIEPTKVEATYTNTIVLVGQGQPRVLAQLPLHTDDVRSLFQIGTVALSGAQRGRALLYWPEGDHSLVRVVDTTMSEAPVIDIRTPQGTGSLYLLNSDAGDGSVLFGISSGGFLPHIMRLTADYKVQVFEAVGMPAGERITSAWVRDSRLVYGTGLQFRVSSQDPSTSTSLPTLYTFGSVALDPTRSGADPHQLAWIPTIEAADPRRVPWHAGAHMLVYLTPKGELRAVGYDGTGDVLLDQGIEYFYTPGEGR